MPSGTAATLQRHEAFHSSHLPSGRDIVVYLPPGYADDERSYPVLFMHDGQNLFEPERAFVKGEHWRVGETASALIEASSIEPLIIVGIDNTGEERIDEYTPTYDRRRGGGMAAAYGRFIVEELKPFIDLNYRTQDARLGMAGSSLGALVTLYLGLTYPHVFSRLAVMSPSVWWDRRAILREVRRAGTVRPFDPSTLRGTTSSGSPRAPSRGDRAQGRPRIWLDMGTAESRGAGSARRVLEDARLLKAGLLKAGWVDGADLHYEEVAGGTHSERAWGERFGRVLQWLYPPEVN